MGKIYPDINFSGKLIIEYKIKIKKNIIGHITQDEMKFLQQLLISQK